MDTDTLKYPIGKFIPLQDFTFEDLQNFIREIEHFPAALHALVVPLDEEALEWKYRPGGWNIRQVVHHCADSHLNSFCRYKLTLTEDRPQIRPYLEDKWAELADYQTPVSFALNLLENLHIKWTYLLRSLSPEQLELEYFHPESKKYFNLYYTTMLYAWHGNHHLAHIRQAIESQGKYNS